MKETALYFPLREMFHNLGYTVKGEVNDIDLMAVKDDHAVAVELKVRPCLKLIYQAIARQKECDKVYVAVPKASLNPGTAGYRDFVQLLKRLSLGLILVDDVTAEIVLDPAPSGSAESRKPVRKRKENTLDIFFSRKNDINVGGSQKAAMTNYKENALRIARILSEKKIATLFELRALSGVKDTSSILSNNFYDWFERIERGLYRLSQKGIIESAEGIAVLNDSNHN